MAGTLSVISTVKNGISMLPEASLLHPASFLKQPTSRTTDTSASLCPHALSLPTSAGPVTASEPTHFNKNFAKRTSQHNSTNSTRKSSSSNPANKTQKLNLEVSPHRAVSAVRLMRVELGGAFADLLNENGKGSGYDEMRYVENTLGFRTRALDDRDKRLVTDIVGGTIRWRRYLDYVILSLCNNADTFTSMEPLLLQILRLGVYEIIKLEMPAYAVVDENVRLAKVALRPGAGNMVNGILRKLALLKESNSLPTLLVEGNGRQQARTLATIYSHPVWMVRRWMKYHGCENAIKLMTWNNKNPSFSLRANTGRGFTRANLIEKLEMLKVQHRLSANLDDFVCVETGMQSVVQSGLLRDGFCSVQDESAGLVVSILDPQPGESIVDCCAAPGGKTLFIASRLHGEGMVTAVDINKGRLRILEETAKVQNVDHVVTVVHADLRTFVQEQDQNLVKYDKVLLDAPCSGLGVLSKRADLRWNRRLEDMEQLKKLQDELLDSASTLVKPGGVLVYSTCSIDVEENEERVASFLLRHPEFSIVHADKFVSSCFVTEQGFYLTNPVKHSMDGAFAARLVRC